MSNNITLKQLFFSMCALLLTISLSAQVPTFTATQNIAKGQGEKISSFTDYQTFTLDMTDLDVLVEKENGNTNFRLKIGQEFDWSFDARNTNLIAPEYQNRTSDNNKSATAQLSAVPTQGYVNGVQADLSALTIGENFLYGFIEEGNKTYYIEPLTYFLPDAAADAFILYEEGDVIKDGTTKCAAIELDNQSKKSAPKEENPDVKMMNGECYTVDLAIASDYSMYQKYGSVSGVENHTVGVMNNVATDYDDAFADEIQFEIVEQYIVTTSGGNPWSSSNDAGTLLSSFRSWGPSGFSATHDLGQLWTNRNFTGSTVGIAYVGAVCSNYRYQCLQDFTSNAWSLRVLTSHETGHNFNCSHDASGSPHIMAPSVNNTASWSSNSINTVNNYVNNISCLASCGNGGGGGGGGGGTPPTAQFTANPTSGCAPLNVQFTNQSIGATSYLWTFAGSTTTSQTNPAVTFTAPGTYSVTLVATNASGSDTETKTNYITVGSGNTNLSFTKSVNGNTVSFNNNSTGANSYSWNFGDNNTSTQTNPTHTYSSPGTYTVTLTGVGDCGTESTSQTVTIQNNLPPVADFYAPQTSGCTPLAVNFVSTSTGNPTAYQWSFPGGTPSASALPNPQITYATEGVYDVYLTVFNQNGSDTRTISNYISVTESPIISFTTSQSGNTVTFNNNSEGASSYLWYFGDGTSSTEPNPVHTYGNTGTYSVVLTGFSNCGQVAYNSSVTIANTPPPNAAFTVSATQGCAPHEAQFYNQSSGQISNYAWSFPGGNPATSNSASPTVIYENEGNYPVTLTVSGNGGSSTETKQSYISVINAPVLDYNVSQTGALVTIDNNTEGDHEYLWNFGDGYTSISPNPYHTYEAGGTYTISVTASGFCGTMTDSFTVTIDAPPTANFTANQTFGCTDFVVNYENISTGNNNAYQWSFPGGTPSVSTQENPTITYTQAGTYNASLTVSNALGEDTFTENNFITVNALPVADFSFVTNGFEATFLNNSENADSYFWNFGDNETNTEANPTHTFTDNGTYTVSLTAINECGEISTNETLIISVESNPIADFTANVNEGCAPLTVTFNNTSSSNSDSFVWYFTGGNIETSEEENPTVTFSSAGTFDVTLIATNEAGSNTKTELSFITVNDLPTANFTYTPVGNTVSFENLSTNATAYTWDFGNENTSNESNPTQVFAENGTYEVVLTASNDCGETSISKTIEISIETAPNAQFSVAETFGCAPFSVQLQNETTGDAISYLWAAEGAVNPISEEENPIFIFNEAGTYSIALAATNATGTTTETKIDYITVGDLPTANFTFTQVSNGLSMTDLSIDAESLSWNFGDGTIVTDQSDPYHVYEEDGQYNLTLYATNACGVDSLSATISVLTVGPIADFTADATEGCAPFTVNFENTSTNNPTSFLWIFEGANIENSLNVNPTVSYPEAGEFTVTLVVYNAFGVDSTAYTNLITVNPQPIAEFETETNGQWANFTNNSQFADSYLWDFGDETTSTEENPSHLYQEAGDYEVSLTVMNTCDTLHYKILLEIESILPTAVFGSDIQDGCADLTIQFADESLGNPTAWSWSFPGGNPATSTEQNPVVTYESAGDYTAALEVTNESGTGDLAYVNYISVSDVPNAEFTFEQSTTFVDFMIDEMVNTDYTWDFGDGNASTFPNTTHDYEMPGIYVVTLTAENECGTSIFTAEVTATTTSTETPDFIDIFEVYPNPNDGQFTIRLEGDRYTDGDLTIRFTNVVGQVIDTRTVSFNGSLQESYGFRDLPAGLYLVQIEAGNNRLFKKIVVE